MSNTARIKAALAGHGKTATPDTSGAEVATLRARVAELEALAISQGERIAGLVEVVAKRADKPSVAEKHHTPGERFDKYKSAPLGARVRDRLPDLAQFVATYDADSQMWAGSLSIPGISMFVATSSGLFKLLTKLDDLYRDTLESPEK